MRRPGEGISPTVIEPRLGTGEKSRLSHRGLGSVPAGKTLVAKLSCDPSQKQRFSLRGKEVVLGHLYLPLSYYNCHNYNKVVYNCQVGFYLASAQF